MADEDSQSVIPSVSYAYHTYNPSTATGGPLFILLYIQCAMFLINSWLQVNMELWQLIFPTFVVVIVMVVGIFNNGSGVN